MTEGVTCGFIWRLENWDRGRGFEDSCDWNMRDAGGGSLPGFEGGARGSRI